MAGSNIATHQKQSPEVFCKKVILKNFAKFKGKQLCKSLFLIKHLQYLFLYYFHLITSSLGLQISCINISISEVLCKVFMVSRFLKVWRKTKRDMELISSCMNSLNIVSKGRFAPNFQNTFLHAARF